MPETDDAEKPQLIVVGHDAEADEAERKQAADDQEEQDVNSIVLEGDSSIEEPGKVIRIGSMIKQLLEEVRNAGLDEPSRARLADIYETSVKELGASVSEELRNELAMFAAPFKAGSVPSEAELRIAQAQLVGWLEGLFHGIQATLVAQQVAAQAQLAQMRQRGLPAGSAVNDARSGQYL